MDAARIVAMYRRFLTLSRRLTPAAERVRVTAQIRAAFRASASETDPAVITSLMEKARGQLSYLRIIAPRRAGDEDSGDAAAAGGSGGRATFAIRDGSVVDASLLREGFIDGKVGHSSYASGAAFDASAMRRHQASLDRFRFKGPARGAQR